MDIPSIIDSALSAVLKELNVTTKPAVDEKERINNPRGKPRGMRM